MFGIPCMALAVPGLIRLEMMKRLISARRQGTLVPAPRIVTVINMAIEPSMAMKPGSSSNEYSAGEPVWPIVTIGRAVIGRIVIVAVGAARFDSYADCHLAIR